VLRYVGGIGLLAARQFKFLAVAQSICGVATAVTTAGFILWQGYAGAIWGVAIGNAACLVWEMVRLRGVRQQRLAAATAQPN